MHPLLDLKPSKAMDLVHPAMRWRRGQLLKAGPPTLRKQCTAHWRAFPRCAEPCRVSASKEMRLRGTAYDPMLGGT